MKSIALIVTLLGIISLLSLFYILPLKIINSQEELIYLQDNQKVQVKGKVIEEKFYENLRILVLNNNLTLKCACPLTEIYKDKTLQATAILDSYSNKKQLTVLKISIR